MCWPDLISQNGIVGGIFANCFKNLFGEAFLSLPVSCTFFNLACQFAESYDRAISGIEAMAMLPKSGSKGCLQNNENSIILDSIPKSNKKSTMNAIVSMDSVSHPDKGSMKLFAMPSISPNVIFTHDPMHETEAEQQKLPSVEKLWKGRQPTSTIISTIRKPLPRHTYSANMAM
jgi:hypothetical protein